MESYEVYDFSSSTAKGILKYKLSQIENIELSHSIRAVTLRTVTDPHEIIIILQKIQLLLTSLSSTPNLIVILIEELGSLNTECKIAAKNALVLCRKLNPTVQSILYKKEHNKLILIIEEFMRIYPLYNIVEKVITIAKKIIPYCEGELLDDLNIWCEFLQFYIRLSSSNYISNTLHSITY